MRKSLLAAAAALAALSLAPAADQPNHLKDNEPPPGFTALFNGKNLDGWHGLIDIKKRGTLNPEQLAAEQKKADELLSHWTVVDGVLTYDGKGNSLQSAKDYGDFELYVDWKIEEKGDSGIYIRGQPQVQVWDSDNSPGAKGEDKNSGSGGLWNNTRMREGKIPFRKADRPIGEWNTFHIVMKGEKVWVWLNGVLVVENATLENYWEPGKPLPAKGPIELQHHGDKLWFKNVFIKEMTSDK
jgi:hypothetical protein